jgi:hypothetical protein
LKKIHKLLSACSRAIVELKQPWRLDRSSLERKKLSPNAAIVFGGKNHYRLAINWIFMGEYD